MLRRCLAAIAAQRTSSEVEVVIVDSGSSDDSREVATAAGAGLLELAPESFSHGASRNLGARHARGEILVFLSQDAIPVDAEWLERLVAPLAEPGVGGAYGRQLPNLDATPPEAYFLNFLYGAEPRRQVARSDADLSMATTLFSNVNSTMPRSLWERLPFAEDIVMSEDQEWSRRVLLEGLTIAYEPAAAVRHSHNYTLRAAFRRFFDSGASSSRAYLSSRRHSGAVLRSEAIRYASGEMTWLWRTGQRRWIPYAVLYESTKMAGLVAGANHERIPIGLKRRFSALPLSWENGYS